MSDGYLAKAKKDIDDAYMIVDRQIRTLKYGEDEQELRALHRLLDSARRNFDAAKRHTKNPSGEEET